MIKPQRVADLVQNQTCEKINIGIETFRTLQRYIPGLRFGVGSWKKP